MVAELQLLSTQPIRSTECQAARLPGCQDDPKPKAECGKGLQAHSRVSPSNERFGMEGGQLEASRNKDSIDLMFQRRRRNAAGPLDLCIDTVQYSRQSGRSRPGAGLMHRRVVILSPSFDV